MRERGTVPGLRGAMCRDHRSRGAGLQALCDQGGGGGHVAIEHQGRAANRAGGEEACHRDDLESRDRCNGVANITRQQRRRARVRFGNDDALESEHGVVCAGATSHCDVERQIRQQHREARGGCGVSDAHFACDQHHIAFGARALRLIGADIPRGIEFGAGHRRAAREIPSARRDARAAEEGGR
jgi:hypothetical protein